MRALLYVLFIVCLSFLLASSLLVLWPISKLIKAWRRKNQSFQDYCYVANFNSGDSVGLPTHGNANLG
jgi:capsule polysaccharide modification protein KpsS